MPFNCEFSASAYVGGLSVAVAVHARESRRLDVRNTFSV